MEYNVTVLDPGGGNERQIAGLLEVQVARSFNTVGNATFQFSDRYYRPSDWVPNMRFKVFRRTPTGTYRLLGNTVWFLKQPIWHYSSKTWEIKTEDTISILNNPLVAYTSDTLYADKTIDNGNYDYADNLLKAYVRENMGSLAQDGARNLEAYLTVDGNSSLGPLTEKTASFQELLSVLTSICQDAEGQGVPIYFDVVPSGEQTFVFRTYKDFLGQDKTTGPGAVSFGTSWNNLTEIDIAWDYATQVTVAYVGGVGDGAGRLIEKVEDRDALLRNPFARIERFVDMKDEDRSSVLQAAGRTYLAKQKAKATLTGRVIDTPYFVFGRDFDYGDQVRAAVGTFEFISVLSAFSAHWTGGKEELDLRLKGIAI